MKFFKRISTLSRINDAIYDLEKNLLDNQHNLDHFQALVAANQASLKRLRSMRETDTAAQSYADIVQPQATTTTAKAKLRAAA